MTTSNGDSATAPSGGELAQQMNEGTKKKYTKGSLPLSPTCQLANANHTDRKVGEGTYAVVHLGHVKATGLPVAIKKIKLSAMADGISMDAIREVKFLQELRHENIIRLVDVFSSKNQNLNLVLEFLDSDLEMIIKDTKIGFGGADIKSWLAMALRGLWWCHKNFVLHRVQPPPPPRRPRGR